MNIPLQQAVEKGLMGTPSAPAQHTMQEFLNLKQLLQASPKDLQLYFSARGMNELGDSLLSAGISGSSLATMDPAALAALHLPMQQNLQLKNFLVRFQVLERSVTRADEIWSATPFQQTITTTHVSGWCNPCGESRNAPEQKSALKWIAMCLLFLTAVVVLLAQDSDVLYVLLALGGAVFAGGAIVFYHCQKPIVELAMSHHLSSLPLSDIYTVAMSIQSPMEQTEHDCVNRACGYTKTELGPPPRTWPSPCGTGAWSTLLWTLTPPRM